MNGVGALTLLLHEISLGAAIRAASDRPHFTEL
jgi:hypothetical protein